MHDLTTRNATITDLLTMLQTQQARKHDIVAPATALRFRDGILHVTGSEPVLTDDGVTTGDGTYRPTAVMDEGLADKLGVPVAYLKRLREQRPDLYDANLNGWLHGRNPLVENPRRDDHGVFRWEDGTAAERGEQRFKRERVPADPRSFMVRTFTDLDGGTGIARAFLSDKYAITDNLDVLMATLDGIRDAGVRVDITGGDLTDRRMVVRVNAPEVQAYAPELLRGYRSPFTGQSGSDNPTVFAGLVISNSETGGGAFTITPRITVQVCSNGMTLTRDALRAVHLGGKMDEGVIRWTADTQAKNLAAIKAKTRDAVATFLDVDYVTNAVARLEARASEPLTTVEVVRDVTKAAGYTQADIDGMMTYFVQGGQMNRAGVVNALTAYAQTVEDGDAAYDIETRALAVLGV